MDRTMDAEKAIESRASRYRDERKRRQFRYQVLNPPIVEEDGKVLRRTGSAVYYPYWRGYDGWDKRPVPGSGSDIAYMAGRFRRHLETLGLLPVIAAEKPAQAGGLGRKFVSA